VIRSFPTAGSRECFRRPGTQFIIRINYEKKCKVMKNKYIKLYLEAFTLIILLSIGICAQSTRNSLSGKHWSLTEMNGKAVKNSKAFVEFNQNDNRFTGNAGCNRMFGEYKLNGSKIDFSNVGTTKRFCSQPDLMKLETAFTRALAETTKLQRNGNELKLYNGNRLILRFTASGKANNDGDAAISGKLEESKWFLDSVKNKSVGKLKEEPFVVFDKEKQSAGGNSSCNSFGGNYKTENTRIEITEIISTMRACVEDNRMEIEREFLDGLQKSNRFEMKNGKLFLYRGNNVLLTFVGRNKT
jgi:heat shock protein HslJ